MSESSRWTRVDRVARVDRTFITPDDQCFYYLQRDSLGFSSGPRAKANSLIINFKKKPEVTKNDERQAHYKQQAINFFASAVLDFFQRNAKPLGYREVLLVPIPTSKPRDGADYDNRMDELCRIVSDSLSWVDYAPILDTRNDLGAAHEGSVPRNPECIKRNMFLSDLPPDFGIPKVVFLIDDVLTTGAHYAACRDMIHCRYPDLPIFGLFLSIHMWQKITNELYLR